MKVLIAKRVSDANGYVCADAEVRSLDNFLLHLSITCRDEKNADALVWKVPSSLLVGTTITSERPFCIMHSELLELTKNGTYDRVYLFDPCLEQWFWYNNGGKIQTLQSTYQLVGL